MAVTKKIEIDGKEVTFKASAAVPRLYRIKFGRDIYKDLRQLEKSVGENDEDNSDLDLLTIGLVNDMFTERQNDDYPYKELASQADFDKF
ncbi:hypothetical protein [Blautia sp. 1033sp1_1033st1_G9_1033SCRN_220408]|uniref:hypothetical protein n=1 Tax=Blautia sp. 1033sp1_1033st1_G9_1033SCRN_220408 TaxID=3144490 RepID=UPI0034A38C13